MPHPSPMFIPKPISEIQSVRVGTGVIVRDRRGHILLEQRSDCGLWGLPGGRIEAGETISLSAAREVLEETGLTITIAHLQGVYSDPHAGRIVSYPDNVVQLVDIILIADAIDGVLTCSPESLDLQWFAPDQLPPASEIVPPAHQPLKDYIEGRSGVFL